MLHMESGLACSTYKDPLDATSVEFQDKFLPQETLARESICTVSFCEKLLQFP